MSKTTKIIVALVIGLVIGALGTYFLVPKTELLGGTGVEEVYNSVAFQDGLFAKNFSEGGAILTLTSTSTQATSTITEAQLLNYKVFNLAATNTVAQIFALPATSTWITLLPNAGDTRTWFIDNQHVAATTTTIMAGTGIDLIAYTNADDVFDGQEIAELKCYRLATTDVRCITSELLKAD